MATGGLYGQSSAGIVSPQSGSESVGLYGNNTVFGGTYFEWFIFQVADIQPATPTGGSWDFTTNTGTPPTGWIESPPSNPTNTVWVSVGVVSSKNNTAIQWSTPGKFSFASGLPILSGAAAPLTTDGQADQIYIETGTSPKTIWFKQTGTWTRLTGQTLYVDLVNTQSIGGVKTFTQTIQGSISGSANNVTGVVTIAHGGTGATTASAARSALGAAASGANSDITSLSGITGGISTADYLQLDTAITPSVGVAKLQWDTTWGGPQIGMEGGNVNLQIGQETLIKVYNNTGSALTDGQVVYVTGSQGQRLTVALAQANADSTSAAIIGMVTEPIANNASGFVTTQGMVNAINTTGAVDGDVVYLSPTTAGGWTTTKPVAPQHMVMVGYIVKGGSAGAGSIYVNTQNGYELEELHNVLITNPTNGQTLVYNSSTSVWENSNTFASPKVIEVTDNTNAALRITQLGTGNALLVEDSSNPDATPFVIDASGNVVSGSTASIQVPYYSNGTNTTPLFQVAKAGGFISSLLGSSSSSNFGPSLSFSRSSGDSLTVPTVVSSGFDIGSLSFQGYDGTNFIRGAEIIAEVDGTPGTNDMPGRLVFSTTADGASSPTERMRIGSSGGVGIGGADGSNATLYVRKNITGSTSSFGIYQSGQVQSDVTTVVYGVRNDLTTAATAFTLASYYHYYAQQSTIGAGSAVTNQYGFYVGGSLTGATNNYGFHSNIASGTGRYNFYANGTADNYFAGNVGIGTSSPAVKLDVISASGSVASLKGTGTSTVSISSSTSGNPGVGLALLGASSTSLNWLVGSSYITGGALQFIPSTAAGGSTFSTAALTLDPSGNLGLGVTPSAWGTLKAFEVGGLGGTYLAGGGVALYLGSNNYYNGTNYVYKTSDYAAQYQQLGGKHLWFTAPYGTAGNAITFTQAMTLDASGNLGIGTTSPAAKLHTVGTKVIFQAAGPSQGSVQFGTTDTTHYIAAGNDYLGMNISSVGTGNTGIHFITGLTGSGAEAARIDSSGNLLVGTTSAYFGEKVTIINSSSTAYNITALSSSASYTGGGIISGSSATTSTNLFRSFTGYANGGINFQVLGNGNVVNTNNSYGSISDLKLKENIVDVTPKLEELCKVRIVNYNLKADPENKQIGVIAQELEQVFPSMVEDTVDLDSKGNALETTTKTVKYSVFVPMLIKAIQEQQAIIEQLKARLDAANL